MSELYTYSQVPYYMFLKYCKASFLLQGFTHAPYFYSWFLDSTSETCLKIKQYYIFK